MRTMCAEWDRQRLVLMSFPHQDTDWADDLNASLRPFIRIAQAISYTQPIYILCADRVFVSSLFCSTFNMTFIEIPTDDTWIRDYGYISIIEDGQEKLLDFTFDGWGGKFEASKDNNVNKLLHQKGYMGTTVMQSIDFVLEGGSVESDGDGTILTTTKCLCNPNRNAGLNKAQIEDKLEEYLGANRVLWLDYGYLAGDDTDSHIDTLARFVDRDTIIYVECEDKDDEHYEELNSMYHQLKGFRCKDGQPYNLIALPMTSAIYYDGDRLPATYANFLITNKAIIYPTYNDAKDKEAHQILKDTFKDREIIPVDCRMLITQGGSLHCSTMQV